MSRIYFTDRNLGKRFPEILISAGLQVERHHDLFPQNGSDEQWLKYCGRKGRVAITQDERIRYRPNEIAAIKQYCAAVLIVVGKAKFSELAENFVVTLPKIESFLLEHHPPWIAKVYRPRPEDQQTLGRIQLWWLPAS